MSLRDYKISAYEKSISALEDRPKMSAAELKAVFDSRTDREVKQAINGLIEALMATEAAKELGAENPGTKEKTALQTVLDVLYEAVEQRAKTEDVYTIAEADAATDEKIDQKIMEIGAGDMAKAVYDPNNVRRDVFEAIGEAVDAADNAQATADSAVTAAGNAQDTANAALPKANFSWDASTATLNITL